MHFDKFSHWRLVAEHKTEAILALCSVALELVVGQFVAGVVVHVRQLMNREVEVDLNILWLQPLCLGVEGLALDFGVHFG